MIIAFELIGQWVVFYIFNGTFMNAAFGIECIRHFPHILFVAYFTSHYIDYIMTLAIEIASDRIGDLVLICNGCFGIDVLICFAMCSIARVTYFLCGVIFY